MSQTTTLACRCGKFHIELSGEPFIAAECHCNSCREAARRMAAVDPAMPPVSENGGTPYILYRKDRISFPDGTGLLSETRLSDDAPTRRVVTTCCNTPVFLEFQAGHWISLYATLWPENTRPALDIRTVTSDLPDGVTLDDTIPSGKGATFGFYAKLLWAWIAMGFKVPKIDIARKASL